MSVIGWLCVGSGSEVPLVFLIISVLHQGLGQLVASLHLASWTNLVHLLGLTWPSSSNCDEKKHKRASTPIIDPSILFLCWSWRKDLQG